MDKKMDTTHIPDKGLENEPQGVSGQVEGLAVGKDWKVGTDNLNIILYRRRVNRKTQAEYWLAHGYYATVANALVGLLNQSVKDTKLVDLKTVCDKIDQLRRDIIKACI